MGRQTSIEWADASWNPWMGCRKVSPGCKLCYAERDMTRYGKPFGEVTRAKTTFRDPLKWKDPLKIFTCSWSDWFIKEADPWREEAWEIIRQTPQHTYLILTKRPQRILEDGICRLPWKPREKPWPNVWLGVSAENQELADKRIPILLNLPAAVRWVSYEPALTPVTVSKYIPIPQGVGRGCSRCGIEIEPTSLTLEKHTCPPGHGPSLDWIVVGGESARLKATARPFEVGWAFNTIDQCRAAGIPCFVKQLGSNVRVSQDTHNRRFGGSMIYRGFRSYVQRAEEFIVKLDDWRGGDMSEWPEGLRVREWPVPVTRPLTPETCEGP